MLKMGHIEDNKLLKEARKGLHDWLHRDEIFMAQKAKARCLKEGDANTKFFHGMIRNHRWKAWIGHMEMQDGHVL